MMICELMKAYRFRQKMSLKEMAKKVGISYVSLHRMEHGMNLNLKTIGTVQVWLWKGSEKLKSHNDPNLKGRYD